MKTEPGLGEQNISSGLFGEGLPRDREHCPKDSCMCVCSPQDPQCHPWPHQPPTLGCGPLVCRALRPGQDEHGGEQAQPAGHAHPHAEPQLHRAGGPASPRGAWPHPPLLQVQQGHQVSPGHHHCHAGVLSPSLADVALSCCRGRYLVALGHYYHPEEFTCCQCRKVLDEGGFFEEKGSIFCPKCYDTRYAPSCAKCKKKITGEVMHALKMTWHVQCFTCNACKTPIRNRAFYMEEGQPYCERDYEKMFGTKCRGCDFKIDAGDRFLEALGFSWHDTCFVCAICQTNLEGKTFYSKKDKPLCKSHAFSHV
uniref:Uncharacterized protein n=1 Tax=Corvus moneduloides TaxID=1196302 RepID=A0A8C3E376_CORMO